MELAWPARDYLAICSSSGARFPIQAVGTRQREPGFQEARGRVHRDLESLGCLGRLALPKIAATQQVIGNRILWPHRQRLFQCQSAPTVLPQFEMEHRQSQAGSEMLRCAQQDRLQGLDRLRIAALAEQGNTQVGAKCNTVAEQDCQQMIRVPMTGPAAQPDLVGILKDSGFQAAVTLEGVVTIVTAGICMVQVDPIGATMTLNAGLLCCL